ncbi:aldo/keto reductase [Marisediminicola senii]|uniref:aldo/keto reductase n=1 Tax=Marisediminicola senii TaxID=2711233 RepID=UPI0013ED2A3D|nr:aldo/keto reductase [Marisediminicola senii]
MTQSPPPLPLQPRPSALHAHAPRRLLGQSSLRVFPLALSGNTFGWTADTAATDAILDAYRDHGGNFIDTADSYAGGRSEIMIGNWMRDRRNRRDVVIATKVGKSADNPGVTQKAITRSITASLERLRTDYIDLLYLHIDDSEVAFEETLMAVDAAIGAGKIRFAGASDHSGNRLIEARVIAAQLGCSPLAAVQNRYNLLQRRQFEGTLASVAAQQRLAVMPRFALAGGFLTGKYRTRADVLASTRGREATQHFSRRALRVLAVLDDIAAQHGVAPATIALAWLLAKPNVVAPVASASNPGQVADLVACASVRLTRNQVVDLDRVSA